MPGKKEAVEKLRSYEAVRHSLKVLPLEIRRVEQEMTALAGGISLEPGNRDPRGRENRMGRLITQKQQLQQALERTKLWIEAVNLALEALDLRQRQILFRMDIRQQPDAVERLCQDLEVERSSVYRHRDRALEKFALAFYGIGESKP